MAAVEGIQAFLADLGVPTAVAPSTTSTTISTLADESALPQEEADGAQLRATEFTASEETQPGPTLKLVEDTDTSVEDAGQVNTSTELTANETTQAEETT